MFTRTLVTNDLCSYDRFDFPNGRRRILALRAVLCVRGVVLGIVMGCVTLCALNALGQQRQKKNLPASQFQVVLRGKDFCLIMEIGRRSRPSTAIVYSQCRVLHSLQHLLSRGARHCWYKREWGMKRNTFRKEKTLSNTLFSSHTMLKIEPLPHLG